MLAAPKVGAPVKWVEDRRENLLAAGQVASRARHRRRWPSTPTARSRPRTSTSSPTAAPTPRRGRSGRRPPSACCSPGRTACRAGFATKTIYTNTVGRTAYRGPWQFETLAREVLLDIAARRDGDRPGRAPPAQPAAPRRAAVHEPQRHDLRQHLAARDVRAGARDARLRRVPRRAGRGPPPGATSASGSRTTSSRRRRASATTPPRRRRSASSPRARSTCTSPAARRGTASRPPSSSSPPTRSARGHRRRQHDPGRHRGHRLRRRGGRQPQRVDDRGRGARDRDDPARTHRRDRRAQARSGGRRHRARRQPGERARHAGDRHLAARDRRARLLRAVAAARRPGRASRRARGTRPTPGRSG